MSARVVHGEYGSYQLLVMMNMRVMTVLVRQERQYHLYTNLLGFSNPALVEVDGVKVGVIVFDASLIGGCCRH